MPTYKGNKGNLLQHWVLTELTLLLKSQFQSPAARLALIDAHAMSPYATRSPGASTNVFDVVRDHLPGQGSAYEQAWLELTGQASSRSVEYPTSAMFVRRLWQGPLTMLLCDTDETTIADIWHWKKDMPDSDAIFPEWGDWRDRWRGSFPDATATLVSFDPYMVLHENASTIRRGNMYLADLVQAAAGLCQLRGPALVQLSTYSAQNASQDDVRSVVEWIMRAAEFELVDTVRPGRDARDMMSMILVRDLPSRPDSLNERFNSWFEQIPKAA